MSVIGPSFNISPSDIDVRGLMWSMFDKLDIEMSAKLVIILEQRKGGWEPFTINELDDLSAESGKGEFWLNGLDEEGYVVLQKDGRYLVTRGFVEGCYKASPQNR